MEVWLFSNANSQAVSGTANSLSKKQEEIRNIPDSHLLWLAQQIFRKKFLAIYVMLGTLVSIGLTMVRPILMGQLFDHMWAIVKGLKLADAILIFKNWQVSWLVIRYSLFILGLSVASFIIDLSIGVLNEYIAQRTERDIREEFYASVQSKSMAFHDTAKIGDLMSQATFDVRIINATVSPGLRMISQIIVSAAVAIGMLFYYNWIIALSVVCLAPVYFFAVRAYARKLGPLTTEVQQQFGKTNATLQENVSGIRVVRAFTGEKYEIERFRQNIDKLKNDIIARRRAAALYFPPLILSVSIAISLGLSALFIYLGQMTGGEAITINGALIQLYNPTYMISWALFLTQMGLAGAKRILKTMKEEEIIIEKPEAIELKDIKDRIVYEHVYFSYEKLRKKGIEDGVGADAKPQEQIAIAKGVDESKSTPLEKYTLKDICFEVKPGDIVAILGPTGCGKSTLTKLLARMYDVDKGRILIDDIDIQDLTLESLRKNIGVIEQDIFLFSTTIKENIAYGLEREVSDEEIIEIAKAAQAHEFITSFKDGYDTLVGERGITLSGGQKQRIAIARAFLADPKILMLDDSASAIDAQTEEKIQKAMDNLLKDRTVFIITHRLATIKRANKIIVIRKGEIVAQGTHEALLRTSEDYRRVFGRHVELPPLEVSQVVESPVALQKSVEGALIPTEEITTAESEES